MTLRILLAVLLVAPPLRAQADSSNGLFTRNDAKLAIGAAALSVAVSLFDPKISNFFRDSTLSHVRTGQRLDDVFTRINETTLTVAGVAAYGIGRLTRNRGLADVALHTTEAVFLASVGSQLIRGPLGWSRPHVTDFQDQYDFKWFKGFREFNYRAFPSIHSSSGFAAATALVQETRRRRPGSVKVVAPVLYGLALTPGLSRMYLGQHWASDIIAGAFMGTMAGLKVVKYSHDRPSNRFDRWLLPGSGTQLNVTGSGVGFTWGRTF